MKVLVNNYNNYKKDEKPYRTLICDGCGSKIEYDEGDVEIGEYGFAFVRCPLCKERNFNEERSIALNMNNIKFPTHFHHSSASNGAVDLCNEEHIKAEIRRVIDSLRKNKDVFSMCTSCGNLYVSITKLDEDEVYEVIVAPNYYITEISFEEEDY